MATRRHRRRRSRRAQGRLPASPATAAPPRPAILRLLGCDGERCEETTLTDPAALAAARSRWPVIWIDVEGLDDGPVNALLGQVFEIGDLALEDATTPDERPKLEVFGHQLLVAVRMVRFDDEAIVTDPVGLFLGDRHLITFRDRHTHDGFEGVRQRIRSGRTRLGREGADHLCALLLDAVVDGYFPVLEKFGERLEHLEDDAIDNPTRDALGRIHDVRTDLMTLRRALWPTRDVLHALGREQTPFVGDHARQHFRDCYDHTMELLDLMEGYREISSDLRDIYLASLNNRMNDVMKLLTVIATVFMPLTFITGWYGMNFDTASPWNLPLLRFPYGSLVAAAVMVLITVAMVAAFWRRGWLRRWH
ncbi:MAG: magnesium/cobalt transporter CorA [Planctomycetes bacterium]|nr:magnesium/cobalt transporter CorA [Planctomycetota bacterium]